MAYYAYCRIQYQTIHVVSSDGTGTNTGLNGIDFITGDLGTPTTFFENGLAITGSQGTTLTANEITSATVLDVASVSGLVVGQDVAIELDVAPAYGTHFWTRITNVGATDITVSPGLPSAASIGQQVVSTGQLATTTGFSVFQDFKNIKANGIVGNTEHLRQGTLLYNNEEFTADSFTMSDTDAALSSHKDASKYSVQAEDGDAYNFTDDDDAAALADVLKEFNTILITGQNSLLSSVALAINSQAAMDAIVDSRTTPVPTGSGTAEPPVQYDSTLRDNITMTASGAAVTTGIEFRNSGGSLAGGVNYDHNVGKLFVESDNNRIEINGNDVGIYAGSAVGTVSIESNAPDTTPLFYYRTHGANGDFYQQHIGSRDPEGLISQDPMATYMRKAGDATGMYIKSTTGFTNTGWRKVSANASNIIEVYSDDDLVDVAGVVTVSATTTFVIKGTVVTSKRFVINSGVDFNFTGMDFGAAFVYTGSGTLFSGNGAGFVRILSSMSIVAVNPSAKCFDLKRIANVANIASVNFVDWGDMGSIVQSNIVTVDKVALRDITLPLIFDDIAFLSLGSMALINPSGTSSNPFMRILNTRKAIPMAIQGVAVGSALNSGESAFYVSPDLLEGIVNSTFSFNAGIIAGFYKNLFESGTTGSFTVVADATLASRTITAFADADDDDTTVTTSVAHGYFEGETVTITGTTNYNGTFKIQSIPTTTTFVIPTAFVADDATGTSNNPRMTITETGTTLTELEAIKIYGTLDSNSYDGGYTVFNVQTNSFDVSETFVATDTGNYDTGSLTEIDPSVIVSATSGVSESSTFAYGAVIGNTDTTSVADGTYGNIDLSTAFAASDVTERFKLINADNGIFQYTGYDNVTLNFTVNFSIFKTGGSQDYLFNVSVNGATPTAVAITANVSTVTRNVVGSFPVTLEQGDNVRLQINGVGTTNSVTFSGMQMSIK